jgi:hypothetical protein
VNMKTTLNKIALAFLLMLVPALCQAQQNYLTQTSLAAAVAAPANQPIAAPVPYTYVTVASSTGITGILLNQSGTINQQNQWEIFVDRELMAVVAVNGNVLQVQRGVGGTLATSHANGAMVLAGRSAWFYVADPGTPSIQGIGNPSNQPCVLANVLVSPYVNIRTGQQWICSPFSLTWAPGFGNPYLPQGPVDVTNAGATASVAGATNIAWPFTRISGANAITSFTFTGNGAIGVAGSGTAATTNNATSSFCIIPATGSTWTTTATNNIGAAITAAAGVQQCWYWSGQDGKWYPLGQ